MNKGYETRRAFLTRASVAGAAAATCGTGVAIASPPDPDRAKGRRVVGGSPYATFSRAVAFDRVVFVAGVVGQKPGTRDLVSTEFEPQCRQAMQNLKESVEAAGSTMEAVLKCTCFLTDFADFSVFNEIYHRYFPSNPPARSTVVVKELVVPNAKLEIDCITCVE